MLEQYKKRSLLSIVFLCLLQTMGSCSPSTPGKAGTDSTGQMVNVTFNPDITYQTIDHFGASDAWACQFVGNWPDQKKNAIADLLFSNEMLGNGQPKGIGLSLWRFNIGAGTTEQGEKSGIKDSWRRAESFLQEDGTYNWNKQAGQIWFLKAAKQRGTSEFLAFQNSPPVQYTKNNKGYATNGMSNLDAGNIGKYTEFLAQVIKGIKNKTGITFNYISPVNEPQWDWSDGGQEGTPFYNNEIAQITRSLSTKLIENQLPTKINIAEAGQLDYLYSEFNRKGRSNQINAFFDETSEYSIKSLPNITAAISGHSYWSTSPFKAAVAKRKDFSKVMQAHPGLKFWMSEYCILGDNDGDIKGEEKDLGITPALYLAQVIHNDLVHANASAWHWWTAISAYDYKDGLVYIDKNEKDGNFQASKMLWALGNYSRFIRPGAVRIQAGTSSENNDLLISAFKNIDQQLVMVIINTQTKDLTAKTNLTSGKYADVMVYKTSADSDLAPMRQVSDFDGRLTIPARSIITITGAVEKK